MNSNTLLDAFKTFRSLASDYALARYWKISPNSIRDMRRMGLPEERAYQIAIEMDLPPGEILAEIRAERARTPELKDAWRRVAESIRTALAALAFVAFCNIVYCAISGDTSTAYAALLAIPVYPLCALGLLLLLYRHQFNARFALIPILTVALVACGGTGAGTSSASPIPAASADDSAPATPTTGPVYVQESVVYIAWENGTQSAYYMAGPNEIAFFPNADWHYLFRGATASTLHFFFDLPTVNARRVMWRLVWIPQHTRARLFFAYLDPALAPGQPRPLEVVADFSPDDNGGNVSQAVGHPVTAPRVVDVDITDAFNAAIARHQGTVIGWQMQAMDAAPQ